MTFKKLNEVKHLFKNVKDLVLSDNQCSDFESINISHENFPNLHRIDLSNNGIQSIEGMKSWTKKITKLILDDNSIEKMP